MTSDGHPSLWHRLTRPTHRPLDPLPRSNSPLAANSEDELVGIATTQHLTEMTRRSIAHLDRSAQLSQRASESIEFYTRWLLVFTAVLVAIGVLTLVVA